MSHITTASAVAHRPTDDRAYPLRRIHAVAAGGMLLSVAAIAVQAIDVPVGVRATITVLFAVIVPGGSVVIGLVAGGVGVRHGSSIRFRLPPTTLGALVIPISVSVLIATAQLMLWFDVWAPIMATVVLAGLCPPALLGAVAALHRRRSPAPAERDGAAGTSGVDLPPRVVRVGSPEDGRTTPWPA